MTRCRRCPIAAILLAAVLAGAPAAAPLAPPVESCFLSYADGSKQPYLLALPDGRPEGVAIYLHGHGSDRRQGFDEQVYDGCFRKLRQELNARGIAYATLDYRGPASWLSREAEADITQMAELLRARLGVRKVYLTGGSMGGSCALAFAVRHPGMLSGVVALCPATDIAQYHDWCERQHMNLLTDEIAGAIEASYGGPPSANPAFYAGRSAIRNWRALRMPLVVVHGDSDSLIPVSLSRQLNERMQTSGYPFRYVEIPGGDHDAPAAQADWKSWLDFITGAPTP